jgi:hypothetical protein
VATADPTIMKVASEQIVKKGTTTAFRYVDVVKGGLKYLCGDADCGAAVVSILEKEPFDPSKADITNTAPIYGFMVPKKGELIFKTSEKPAQVGAIPEKGGECGNISTISFHVSMLVRLGKEMASRGELDVALTSAMNEQGVEVGSLTELRPQWLVDHLKTLKTKAQLNEYFSQCPWQKNPRNSVRACALKDLLLRFLDAKKVGGKRWFYRPVASLKTKHKGTLVKV